MSINTIPGKLINERYSLSDHRTFRCLGKNIKDNEVRNFEDTILSILKNLVDELSGLIEVLLLSRFAISQSNAINSILAMLLSSFIKYFIGYISLKIREYIESQTFKLEFAVFNDSPVLKILETYLDKNKDNLNINKYYGARENSSKKVVMTDYGGHIDNSLENQIQELKFNIIPDTKYIYNLDGDKINIILNVVDKENSYSIRPEMFDKYILIMSCKKKGLVEEFYKNCEKFYKDEINKSMIHLVDNSNSISSRNLYSGQFEYKNLKTKPLNINKNIDSINK